MSSILTADIVVDLPVDRTFTYIIPEEMKDSVVPGIRVIVPFGRRKVTGYVLDVTKKDENFDLKPVEACLDMEPLVDKKMLSLLQWISNYYFSPLGEVIKSALPAGINSSSNRFVKITEEGIKNINTAGEKDQNLLSLVHEKGELSVPDIEKIFGGSRAAYLIGRLSAGGLVEVNSRLKTAGIKKKKEKYAALQKEITEPAGAGKRAEMIINYLQEKGEMPLGDLLTDLKTTRETVKRVEKKGLIKIFDKEVYRAPFLLPVKEVAPPVLTEDQEKALARISETSVDSGYSPFLLEGITGSGKTEVYIRAIEMAGGNAVVLVPEISLTPQLSMRFRERFGDRVAVLHSGLSRQERYDQWRRIKDGTFDIVVGARSAVFAPVNNLKIIVVDEEHESAYKQEDGVRYNARDVALMRGKMSGAIVILGSATPSLESIINVERGRLESLKLPKRINRVILPAVDIVDMRKEPEWSWISAKLKSMIDETLERKEQVILFLNRRGFSPFVLCEDCGYTFKCRNCTVSLTWHKERNLLRCHHCDFKMSALPLCPVCGGGRVKGLGEGTEKLESELGEIFEDAVIARVDRDTIRGKGKLEKILNSFERGDINILIGTQMIAKGHHFPGVTLVGVLLADLSLNVPDFRAAERTFQLITQVAGRAGRGDKPGRVVIQTYSPEHYSILHGGSETAEQFYKTELSIRKELSYPPFTRLLNFRIEGIHEGRVINCAEDLKSTGRRLLSGIKSSNIELLGPAPSPMARIKGKFRWQLMARCKDSAELHSFAKTVLREMKKKSKSYGGAKIITDFDPYNLT